MSDSTEGIRRVQQAIINQTSDEELINIGNILENRTPDSNQTWTTDELAQDFTVLGFLAPYVMVKRKSDGKKGSLQFRHSPRIYFNWRED